jgi:PadR family transcriptional regulator PadR
VEIEHDSQILKGVLSLLLLRLLAEQESYGFELASRLRDLGLTGIPDGSIYAALNRLEREGRVTVRLVGSRAGPARKYYRLSAGGYAYLEERSNSWQAFVRALAPLLSAPIPRKPKEAGT